MYLSKHYTCEEIDQRLFEGYYDDFVAAGFVGSKQEFWTFVLSIADKVEKKAGYDLSKNDFTDELKAKLDSIDEGAKAITKVSQLENDLEYQTKADVEKHISDLINGADQALDTLKELADALGNDPNFAATIAGKLGELRTLLDGEISRATAKEDELALDIQELTQDVDKKVQDILDQLEAKGEEDQAKMDNLQEQITQNREDILTFTAELKNQLLQAKAYTDEKVLAEHDRARDVEDKLQDDISTLANQHTTDKGEILSAIAAEANTRESNDAQINSRIDQLNASHSQDVQNLQNLISTETSQRQSADDAINSRILDEASQRQSADATLNNRIESETTRAQAAESALNASLESEATTRKSADDILDHKIEDLKTELDAQDASLSEKLDREIQDRKDADDTKVDKREGYSLTKNDFTDLLLDKLNKIEDFANYVTKTSQLINDSDFQTSEQVNAAIEKVIDLAPDALDTLKELADALGNDPNFAATITTRITQLAEQVNQETENREKADAALQDNIDKANANITNSNALLEAKLKEYVEGIANNLTILIEANTDSIRTEVQDRKDAITEVKGLITAEAESRERNDLAQTAALEDVRSKLNDLNVSLADKVATIKTELGTKIDTNTQNIKSVSDELNLLKEKLSGDSELSEAKLKELSDKISAETDARTLADQTLDTKVTAAQNDINSEVIRASTAESVLQSKIDTLTEAYKTADATLKAELIQSITDFQGDINDEVSGLKDLVSEESLKRQTADATLESKITALESTTTTKIDAVKEKVTDVSDNLNREISRATNEEKALRSLLDTLNQNHTDDLAAINSALGNKVDKVEGKGLSKNDFTDVLKAKLDTIEEHANYITRLSQLVNDANYQTESDVNLIVERIIGAAPEALDTLKELADAIANDPNFAATLNAKITELSGEVKDQAKDVELVKEQLADVKDRNTAQDSLIAQNVANIQRNLELIQDIRTDYFAALDPLNNLISQTIKDLQATKEALEAAIQAEAEKRELEDSILDNKITTEKERAEAAEEVLTNNLAEEVAARRAVTGIPGQEYEPNATSNYISEVTNLNEADQELDKQLKIANDLIESNKEAIDAYTVNEIPISENPVLNSMNVLAGLDHHGYGNFPILSTDSILSILQDMAYKLYQGGRLIPVKTILSQVQGGIYVGFLGNSQIWRDPFGITTYENIPLDFTIPLSNESAHGLMSLDQFKRLRDLDGTNILVGTSQMANDIFSSTETQSISMGMGFLHYSNIRAFEGFKNFFAPLVHINELTEVLNADAPAFIRIQNSYKFLQDKANKELGKGYSNFWDLATTVKSFIEDTDLADTTINKWKEVEAFLSGVTDTDTLTGLLESQKTEIGNYTINSKKISSNPVLSGIDINRGGTGNIYFGNYVVGPAMSISQAFSQISSAAESSYVKFKYPEILSDNLSITLKFYNWRDSTINYVIPLVDSTTSKAGLMSPEDKTLLDSLPTTISNNDTEAKGLISAEEARATQAETNLQEQVTALQTALTAATERIAALEEILKLINA